MGLNQAVDAFINYSNQWIIYLAYMKEGDAETINKLYKAITEATETVSSANDLLSRKKKSLDEREEKVFSKAQSDINTKIEEINTIITKVRDDAAIKAAAVFTKEFSDEASKASKAAWAWLGVTSGLMALTFFVAYLLWQNAESVPDLTEFVQTFGSKMAMLAVLFTATIWSGRNYRAMMHQKIVNKHRALGLETFQAFSSATNDPQIKDAVLLETTRAIFSASSTGYLEAKEAASDQEIRVLDMARSHADSAAELAGKK